MLVRVPAPLSRNEALEEELRLAVQASWAKDGTDDALYARLMANHWLREDNALRLTMPFVVVTKLRSNGKCIQKRTAQPS